MQHVSVSPNLMFCFHFYVNIGINEGISPMKQQLVLTHQYTVLQEAEKKLTGPQKTSTYACYVFTKL
jgi:hypothetical protein